MYESKHFLLGPFVHSVQLGRFKNRTPARFEYIYWDHTKKRPGQPETARDRPDTGNNARRIEILFKSNFYRNYIRVYNCFK